MQRQLLQEKKMLLENQKHQITLKMKRLRTEYLQIEAKLRRLQENITKIDKRMSGQSEAEAEETINFDNREYNPTDSEECLKGSKVEETNLFG
jgi:predicted nuclease with TOPRIM domain